MENGEELIPSLYSIFVTDLKTITAFVLCAFPGSTSLVPRQKKVHCTKKCEANLSVSVDAVCEIIPVFWAFFRLSAPFSQLQFASPFLGMELTWGMAWPTRVSAFWLNWLFLHLCNALHNTTVRSHQTPPFWEPRHDPAAHNKAMAAAQPYARFGAQTTELLVLSGTTSFTAKRELCLVRHLRT